MTKATDRETEIASNGVSEHSPMWSENDVAQALADYRMEISCVVLHSEKWCEGMEAAMYTVSERAMMLMIAKAIEHYGSQ